MRLPALLVLAAALAALDVGDAAPSLEGVTWVKGAAVEPKGAVTVVEFWATWCQPCRRSIPHLSRLQRQYGAKLRVVGISGEERAVVEPFVKDMGERMAYRVGVTTEAGYERWMAGRETIPCAFVVDASGTVVWAGFPLAVDVTLAAVVAGTFDLALAKRTSALHAKLEEQLRGEQPDVDGGLATIAAILAIDPVDEQAVSMRLAIAKAIQDPGLQRRTLADLPLDKLPPAMANDLAWDLAVDPELTRRHLDLARAFIARALAAEPGNPAYLETQARVLYDLGDVDGAIAAERKAIAAAPDDPDMRLVLAYYESLAALRAGPPKAAGATVP